MPATIVELADAVHAQLSGQSFALQFTPQRAYRRRFAIEDLQELRVIVTTPARSREDFSRGSTENELAIGVHVLKAVEPDNVAEIDDLMSLVEEIEDFIWRHRRPPGCAGAFAQRSGNDPAYDPKKLDEQGKFESVLIVTYRLEKLTMDD